MAGNSYIESKINKFMSDKSLGMQFLFSDEKFMSHFSSQDRVYAAIALAMKGSLNEAYALADINTKDADENIKGSSLGVISGVNREIFNDEGLREFASGTLNLSAEELQSLTLRLIDSSRSEGTAQEALFQPFIDMRGRVKNINTQSLTNFIAGSFLGNATLFEPNGEFVKGTNIPASNFAMFIRQGFSANMASAVGSIMSSASDLANLLSEQFQIQQKLNRENIDGNSRAEVTENDIARLIAVNSAASDTLLRLHTESELNQIHAGSIVGKVKVLGMQENAKRNFDSLSVMREFINQSTKEGIFESTAGIEKAVKKINDILESQSLTYGNLSSLQDEVIKELSDNSTASSMLSVIKGLRPSQMTNALVSAVETTLNNGQYTGSSGSKQLVLDNIKKSLYPYVNGSAFYDMPANANLNSDIKAIDRDCDSQRVLRFEQGIRECDEFIAGFIEPKPESVDSRAYESAWRKNPFQFLAKEHKEHLVKVLLDRPSYFGLKGGNSRVLAVRRQEIMSLMNGQESNITSGELYTLLGHYKVGVTGSPQDDMLISSIRSICTRMDYAERRSSIINSRVLENFDLADLNLAADRTLEQFESMNETTRSQVQDARLFLIERNQREELMDNLEDEVTNIISNPDQYSRFFSPEELQRINALEPRARETALREQITSQKLQEFSLYSYQDITRTNSAGETIIVHTLVNEKGEPVLSQEVLNRAVAQSESDLNSLYESAQEVQQQHKNIAEGKIDGKIHTFSEPQYVPEKSAPLKKSVLANEKKAQAEIDKANKLLDEQKKVKEQEEKAKLNKIAKRAESVAEGEHRIMAGLIYFLGNPDNIISASGYMASMAARVNATLASHKTVERTFPGLGVCEGGIHRDTTNSLYSKYSTADDIRNMQRAFKDNGANFITAAVNRLEYKFMKGALTGDAIRHMLTDQKYLNYMGIQDPRGLLEELEKRGIAVPSLSHDGEIKQDINYGDRNEYQRFEESFQSMLKAQKLNLDESTIASLSDSERKVYIAKRDNFYKRFIDARMFETDGSKLRPSEVKQLFLTGALKDAPKSVRIWYNEKLKQTLATDRFGYYDQYRDSKEFLEIDNESSIEFDVDKYKTTLKQAFGYLPPDSFETDKIESYVNLLRDVGADVSGFDLGTGEDKKVILDLLDIKGQTLESVSTLEEEIKKSAQERLQDAKQIGFVIGDESKKEAYAMNGLMKDKDGNPMVYSAMLEYKDRLKVSDDPISGSEQMNAYLVNNAPFIDAIRSAKVDFIKQNGTTKETFTNAMAEMFKEIDRLYPDESQENKEALFRDLLENEGVVGLIAGKDGKIQIEGFEKPIQYMKEPIVSKEVSKVDLITENVGGVVINPTQYGSILPLSVKDQIKMSGNISPNVKNFLEENSKFIEEVRYAKVDLISSGSVDAFDKSMQKIVGEIYNKFGTDRAKARETMVAIMQMEDVDKLSKSAMNIGDPNILRVMGEYERGYFSQDLFESLKTQNSIANIAKPAVVKSGEYFAVNGHATTQILLGGKDGFIEKLSSIKDAYYNGDGTRVINGNVVPEHKGDKAVFCDRLADSIKQELKAIQAIKDPLTKKARMLAFKNILYQQGITDFLQQDKDGNSVLMVVKDELVDENEKLRQDDLKIEKDVEQANEDGLYKTESEVDDTIDNLLDNPDKAQNELVELVADKEFQAKTNINELKAVEIEEILDNSRDFEVPTPEQEPIEAQLDPRMLNPTFDEDGYGGGMS